MDPIGGPAPRGKDEEDYGETTCPICLEILMTPVETNCKHRYCKYCLTKCFLQEETPKTCPFCRRDVSKVSELTELQKHIEVKLVPELGEELKKERDAELTERKEDKNVSKVGDKPFELLLTRNSAVFDYGLVYYYLINENNVITDSMVTHYGTILERYAFDQVSSPRRPRRSRRRFSV